MRINPCRDLFKTSATSRRYFTALLNGATIPALLTGATLLALLPRRHSSSATPPAPLHRRHFTGAPVVLVLVRTYTSYPLVTTVLNCLCNVMECQCPSTLGMGSSPTERERERKEKRERCVCVLLFFLDECQKLRRIALCLHVLDAFCSGVKSSRCVPNVVRSYYFMITCSANIALILFCILYSRKCLSKFT